MTDTVEALRAELDKLRKDFEDFKAYAKPVIDGHQLVAYPSDPLTMPLPKPAP